ncbi:MAG: hypothetical protein NZM10_06725 [Fimbriimonadales bacterium]|nr:hypothetical protein [Fimbriimonadales bacterium]
MGISLPIRSLGIEGIERAVRLWRMNIFYGQLQPFGYWRAWHPDFAVMLRQGQFRFTLSKGGDSLFVEFRWTTPWQEREYSFSAGRFPLDRQGVHSGKETQP